MSWWQDVRDGSLSRAQRTEAHTLLARATRALDGNDAEQANALVQQAHQLSQNDIRLHTMVHLRWFQTEWAKGRPIGCAVQLRLILGAPLGTVARRIRGLSIGEPGGRGFIGTLLLRKSKR